MVAVNKKDNQIRLIGGIAAGIVLLLAVVAGVPAVMADSWKSDALDKTNVTITEINKTNGEISLYGNKLQPSTDDLNKLVVAYESQNVAIEKAKNDLPALGGFAGIDFTGDYKKASDSRAKLVAIYDELKALNVAGANRAKAEVEVQKTMEGIEGLDSSEQAQEAAKALHAAAAQVKAFADSKDGVAYDKEIAAALEAFADSVDAIVVADQSGDPDEMDAALMAFDEASLQLDDLDAKAVDETNALQAKADAIVARLNDVAKELE